jgi:hypothetical protein
MRPHPIRTFEAGFVLSAALVCAGVSACQSGARDTPAARLDSSLTGDSVVPMMPTVLTPLAVRSGAVVRTVRVARDTTTFGTGPAVVVTTAGDSIVVADSALHAWTLDGTRVAVSGLDGAGGFENEGQSLTIVDVASGVRRRVLSDYFPIVKVEVLRDATLQGLLVHMRDGGVGSLHVTVVDPDRGQVFRSTNALGRIVGSLILVAGYGDGEDPVVFGERRMPLRVDTIAANAIATLPLLVIPKGRQ